MTRRKRLRPAAMPTPREIYEHLDRYVVGQARAKRAVAIAAHSHLKRCAARQRGETLLRKSNLLLAGPTGCGKTHIARHLAGFLELPFVVVDATEYTEAGYYGKDVEVMVAELLLSASHNIEQTQRGIIFVDEVDKLARRSHGARTGAGSRDIGGEGVQQSLLKLLEGREVFVPMNVTQHWNKHDFVQIDTRDILFICAGTFSDLALYSSTRRAIGFGGEHDGGCRARRITHKDLLDYGLISELLGRLPRVVELHELDADDLLKILTQPPDSLLREYTELLEQDDVELRVTQGALREMARYAVDRRVGARGLRAIVEEVCEELLFEAPELGGRRVSLGVQTVRERLRRLDDVELG